MWPRGRGRGRGNNRGGGNWNSKSNWNRGSFRGNRGRGKGHPQNFKSPHNQYSNVEQSRFMKNNTGEEIEKLNEIDIGISEYLSNLEGFTGVIKSRYSDFHVNEIDMDGKVVKLTTLEIPKDVPEAEAIEEDDEHLVNRYRIEQLPIETWDKIHEMVENQDLAQTVQIDVTTMTKEGRTKIHEVLKTVFGQKIVASTITNPLSEGKEQKFIVVKLFNKKERVDQRSKWPKTRAGEYVHFVVYKECTDTIGANMQISERLRMKPALFSYAGVKDRRAKTTQWFCTRKVEPSRIVDSTKSLKNIRVGNFTYKKHTLKLGMLKGNRFRIALRNVTATDDVIEKAVVYLKDNGFINYYGLQRFGNCKDVPTHDVGIQLLKGNWKEAINLILKPRKFEPDQEIATAKYIYEKTGCANDAYSKVHKKRTKTIECRLLKGLIGDENNYVNALESVPRNMRLLYIHAFQSYVWNKVVSKRVKEFGLKPIVGDLVAEEEIEENVEGLEDDEDAEEEQEKAFTKKPIKVKLLTESDLSNYTIYDVVLPLPGYDITYPDNVAKTWYEEILEEHGLSLNMPKQKVKTYTLSGAYRKILERVTNLSWKIIGYDSSTASLIRSDYEEIKLHPEPENNPEGKYKGLVLDFCLSSSCYATMALREIMKMDTSVATHRSFDQKMNSEEDQSSITTTQTSHDEKTENTTSHVSPNVQTENETESENAQKRKISAQFDLHLDCKKMKTGFI